jgi:3-hydroxyacyl-CoA dehydrogenase/enoyl-CoA hydratase/carnithine racemase
MGTCFSYGNRLMARSVKRLNEVTNICLIGAGTMGIGIGIDLLNKTTSNITFIDISDIALEKASNEIENHAEGLITAGRMLPAAKDDYLARMQYTKEYSSLKDAQIIWEIATERLNVKKLIFAQIEKHVDLEQLIFVFSNTSSHTTAELAELFTDRFLRDKFLTGHGYFPFHLNRLFDVMKGKYASDETFIAGIAFAEQVLEKKTIALSNDHHGYIADPIFQGMGAIVSWDVKTAQDLVDLPAVFAMITANPFDVLDRTGHMPYTESGHHLGTALPDNDRLRSIYNMDGRHYPAWIEDLEKNGRTGLASKTKEGFFKWTGPDGREKPALAYDPSSGEYVAYSKPDAADYWSIDEAAALDHRQSTIKSVDGLILVAEADDKAGQTFRRYVIPIMLYGLDLIQDGFGSAGDVNSASKVGLRFKNGLIETFDAFVLHFGIDGFLALVRKAAAENNDRAELYDVNGAIGPRKGSPSLLHTMKKRGWKTLLGYGRVYGTPVSQRNISNGTMEQYYNDLRFVQPNAKDRVASIIFDNPLRGNVWNKYTLDQLDHATGIAVSLYEQGALGSILFTASGVNMRMLGADARQFSKGWFDAQAGYQFLGEEEAAYFTKAGMKIFRYIQECPIWTIGVFGEKWGGGAEFTYFLNQRFDVISKGPEFDTICRDMVELEKRNYNQPEIDYAILAGFGAVQELRRLGMGDSQIDEIILQGMTGTRAWQLGLSNAIGEDEYAMLEKAYEVARMRQKFAAPYSVALYNQQKKHAFLEGINDERLTQETGETFNPDKNLYVSTGLLRLLNMGGKNPPMDLRPKGELPGWSDGYDKLFEELAENTE